jgi:gamma-glutamyl-gamma-aminobutyrate hydrolase PuuD
MIIVSAMYHGHCGIQDQEDVAVTTAAQLYDLVARNPNENYCVVFHGGTDIHPGLYSQAAHKTNQQQGLKMSSRDMSELSIWKAATDLQIPIFAICRGAQLACVLSGGSLFQHFETTERGGSIETLQLYNKEKLLGNSFHHQLMDLSPLQEFVDYDLLAWTEYKDTKFYREGSEPVDGPAKQPEIVWFPKTRCLAIQGHPEWADGTAFQKFCIEEFKARSAVNNMCIC